jgi:hypothetical protein
MWTYSENPIILFKPGNSIEREEFEDGFSSCKYSSIISSTDLADKG